MGLVVEGDSDRFAGDKIGGVPMARCQAAAGRSTRDRDIARREGDGLWDRLAAELT